MQQAELDFNAVAADISQQARLLDYLREERMLNRITPEHGIASERLAKELNYSGARTCRAVIHSLRMNGVWIGSNDTGYFFALNFKEIEPTIRTLLAKARETRKPAIALLAMAQKEERRQIEIEFA